jgi:hypothetical protein
MRRISSLLPGLLESIRENDEASLAFLVEFWPDIVGKDLAEKVRPVALQRRMLVLEVPGDVWKKQLAGMRRMICSAINEFWGTKRVEKISLRQHL